MELGYYRLTKPILMHDGEENPRHEVGELYYLLELSADSADVICGDEHWILERDEFESCFVYAPEGVEERQQQIAELIHGLHSVGMRQDNLIASSQTRKLLANPDNPETVQENPKTGTDLAVKRSDDATRGVKNLKKIKTVAAATTRAITRRSKELKAYIGEQTAILEAKARMLSKHIEAAEEVIFILNTYLGKNEEIVRIKKGKPAPAEEKIHIRQLVLFMDEETAVAKDFAERGGLDFRDITEFDKWLLEPAHLQQVLPETKGIVALKVRRHSKHYNDNPFVNESLNRQNKCLYILIRNGENLYRIHTDLWLDDVFLPRKDEFEDFFYHSEYNWTTRKSERVPLRPGSDEYMESMEKAQKEQRRFYTALILIQGLLDRTKVFQPLPDNNPTNICNIEQAQRFSRFVYDAENLISSGKPNFNEWRKDVNGQLTMGCRIIGNFSAMSDFCGSHGYRERIHPRSAYYPDNYKLYTIEKQDAKSFYFYYQRDGEIVYSGWRDRGHTPVRRASFEVKTSDGFILNFDAVTLEDLRYYLGSRINRHMYMDMIPLLKVAIKLKEEEIASEDPFRKLLIGEIVKKHKVEFSAATAAIDELISWWKFKTRCHRALNSDDSKALRMIVREFGKRQQLVEEHQAFLDTHQEAVELFRANRSNVLAIFYRTNKEYTVYCYHNDEYVFVTEELWKLNDGRLRRESSREWTTVDKRHESWKLLWHHERWSDWKIGVRPQERLTDPEREAAVAFGLKTVRTHQSILNWSRGEGKAWRIPLAATIDQHNVVTVYHAKRHCRVKGGKLTGKLAYPEYGQLKVRWERKGGEVSFYPSGFEQCSITMAEIPWQKKTFPGKILVEFPENIEKARAEEQLIDDLRELQTKLLKPVEEADRQVHDALVQAWYDEEHAKFLEDYEDDEDESMWEDFKEDLSMSSHTTYFSLEGAASYLIEKHINFNGWTLEKLLQEAKKHGWEYREPDFYDEIKGLVLRYTPA